MSEAPMPDPMDSPANRMHVVQATLALAARLSGAVRAGQIDESIYGRGVVLGTGGTAVRLPSYLGGTKSDLLKGIDNIFLLAVSNSAITTAEVLQVVFKDFDPTSGDPMVGIREMVLQVRNAFAHQPWLPTWSIKPQHRRVFPVVLDDGVRYDFDARTLDGQRLKPEDFGGFAFWMQLIQHCEQLAVAHEGEP